MRLRVGLSVAHPQQGPAGPRRYSQALSEALCELSEVEIIELTSHAGSKAARRIWDLIGVSLAARRRSVDILHCTGVYPPLRCQAPVVLTVHDLAIRRLRHAFPPMNQRLGWRVWSRLARRADSFIAVSESTRNDLARELRVPFDRIAVVRHGVGHPFGNVAPNEINRVKRSHALDEPYLLVVGTIEPRKNLPRTVEAFLTARCAGMRAQLVVVGGSGWGQPELQHQLASGAFGPTVRYLAQVTDTDLAALYAGAEALVYPSLYEGFGLPVLEAMACGCPVITSGRGGLAEVAGDAAWLVDPLSVQAITQAMRALVSDPAQAAELRRRGRERAARFTWRQAAELTVLAYRRALAVSHVSPKG